VDPDPSVNNIGRDSKRAESQIPDTPGQKHILQAPGVVLEWTAPIDAFPKQESCDQKKRNRSKLERLRQALQRCWRGCQAKYPWIGAQRMNGDDGKHRQEAHIIREEMIRIGDRRAS
jgi:hypothetical protein